MYHRVTSTGGTLVRFRRQAFMHLGRLTRQALVREFGPLVRGLAKALFGVVVVGCAGLYGWFMAWWIMPLLTCEIDGRDYTRKVEVAAGQVSVVEGAGGELSDPK